MIEQRGSRFGLRLLFVLLVPFIVGAMLLSDRIRSDWSANSPASSAKDLPTANGPLETGSIAPDFTLLDVRSGVPAQFSKFRAHKPAVLILGSFGCTIFCEQLGQLRQLNEEFEKKVTFLFVKIRDAPHPLPSELKEAFTKANTVANHVDDQLSRTKLSLEVMDFPVTCWLDNNECQVEKLYHAYPNRIVIIDSNGRIAQDTAMHTGLLIKKVRLGWDYEPVRKYLRGLSREIPPRSL
jgi:hypothetical protein